MNVMTTFSIMSIFYLLWMLVLPVNAGTIITVNVGKQGSFFDPASVSAEEGDVISFVFLGEAHSVIQCAFENPCVPLPGGFSSGIIETATSPPIWNLEVGNASEPIWFFCGLSMPSPHCAAGMVGVINTPSINMYNQFDAAAKAFNSSIPPVPSLMLSGQGAFATSSPTMATSIQASPTSVPQGSPSSAPNTSPSSNAAIIGGAVGAGVAVLIIVILTFLLFKKRKAQRRASNSDILPYKPPDTQTRNHPHESKGIHHTPSNSTLLTNDTVFVLSNSSTPSPPSVLQTQLPASHPVQPTRRPGNGRPLPHTPTQPPSNLSLIHLPVDANTGFTASTGEPNISALAREVAVLLRASPATPREGGPREYTGAIREIHHPKHGLVRKTQDRDSGMHYGGDVPGLYHDEVTSRTTSPAPPQYRYG